MCKVRLRGVASAMLLVNGTVCGVNEVYGKSLRQEQHTQESPTPKNSPQECPTGAPHKPWCRSKETYKNCSQECPPKVPYSRGRNKSALQESPQNSPTRVSHKSVQQEFPPRVSRKRSEECPTKVFSKGVAHDCPTCVCGTSVSSSKLESVKPKCRTNVSYKVSSQESQTLFHLIQESVKGAKRVTQCYAALSMSFGFVGWFCLLRFPLHRKQNLKFGSNV